MFSEYDFSDINDKATRLIVDVREIVKANKLNINELFKEFDLNQQNDLDIKEFRIFVKSFVPGLNDEEILSMFTKFDLNKDGTISLQEFKRGLSLG